MSGRQTMPSQESLDRGSPLDEPVGRAVEQPFRPGHRRSRRTGLPARWRLYALVTVVALLAASAVVLGLVRPGAPDPSPQALPAPSSADQEPAAPPDSSGVLSNGCPYSARGIPECGALLGAAYGSNTAPLAWEQELGRTLGVHRTYYSADRVPQAVEQVSQDVQRGRMPWISFKLPYSWQAMAAGKGDAWASDLATRLSKVDGPVWLAFHHEPENDGPMSDWTKMQQRLAPLVRALAPNVAYSIILTGWNQMYGPPWLSLDAVWPRNTQIDLVGFDVYNDYGVRRGDGQRDTSSTNMAAEYFVHFQEFAERYGVAWAVAETGITDELGQSRPHWIKTTYQELVKHKGVALTYFNSRLNSTASWRLQGGKELDFADALSRSPTLVPAP